MSIDYGDAKTAYVISGIVIILILTLLAQAMYKSYKKYENGELIAVKTSRGLIKMNARSVADELAAIQADLSRHEHLERTAKFDIQITQIIDNIKQFIKDNPRNADAGKIDTKADILNRAMSEHITPNQKDQHLSHNIILSQDDMEYGHDTLRFDHLLRNINVMIHMLKKGVCDCGVVDIVELERLLRVVDTEVSKKSAMEQYDKSTPVIDHAETLVARNDPYMIPRLSLFASKASQLEGFSVESQVRCLPSNEDNKYSFGPQNIRNAQQRSQMFRENWQKLGSKQYVDEDLLLTQTYDSAAL